MVSDDAYNRHRDILEAGRFQEADFRQIVSADTAVPKISNVVLYGCGISLVAYQRR